MKLAIASLLVVGGVANAANVNVLPSASTGSSLILFIKDVTTSTYFYQELGATVSDVNSFATLASDPVSKYSLDGDSVNGSMTVPSLFGSFSSVDASAFINSGGNSSSNTFIWSILGAKTGPNDNAGQRLAVTTSTLDWLNTVAPGGDAVNGMSAGLNAMIVDEMQSATFTNGKSSTVGYGSTGIRGSQAPNNWFGSSQSNGAGLGVAQYLWEINSSSDGTGANIYRSAAQLTLTSSGTLAYTGADLGAGTSPVPVPAAVWLLGSGLAGLAGIGRRRKLVA